MIELGLMASKPDSNSEKEYGRRLVEVCGEVELNDGHYMITSTRRLSNRRLIWILVEPKDGICLSKASFRKMEGQWPENKLG